MEKQTLRKQYKQIRSLIVGQDSLSKLICKKAIEYIKTENVINISCYFPLANEVDTRDLIDYCLNNLENIYIPHISPNADMKMLKLTSLEELEISDLGLSQIKNGSQKLDNLTLGLDTLEVIFTPLLAFDSNRNRLGYGKGHYDKFFSKCLPQVKKIGLAFSLQETFQVPVEQYDIKLDMIITEKDVL